MMRRLMRPPWRPPWRVVALAMLNMCCLPMPTMMTMTAMSTSMKTAAARHPVSSSLFPSPSAAKTASTEAAPSWVAALPSTLRLAGGSDRIITERPSLSEEDARSSSLLTMLRKMSSLKRESQQMFASDDEWLQRWISSCEELWETRSESLKPKTLKARFKAMMKAEEIQSRDEEMIRTMSDVSWGKRLLLKLEDEMRSRAQCRRETRRFPSLSEALEHQAREGGEGAAQGSHAGGQVPPGDQPVIWYEAEKTLILPHGLIQEGSGGALLVVPSAELHLRGQGGEAGGGRQIEQGATVISRPLDLSDGSSGSLLHVQLQWGSDDSLDATLSVEGGEWRVMRCSIKSFEAIALEVKGGNVSMCSSQIGGQEGVSMQANCAVFMCGGELRCLQTDVSFVGALTVQELQQRKETSEAKESGDATAMAVSRGGLAMFADCSFHHIAGSAAVLSDSAFLSLLSCKVRILDKEAAVTVLRRKNSVHLCVQRSILTVSRLVQGGDSAPLVVIDKENDFNWVSDISEETVRSNVHHNFNSKTCQW
uniref:Right handed beta helix domain-containing protein n=1 Tax=Guillardia theta TaxID=55529 RepID=A0A7S4UGC7_GUITH